MPRNRPHLDRDEKIEEIVGAAARVLLSEGYGGLSFAALAKDLGLARGALYWYFPTKDDLFVAATAQIVTDAVANPPRQGGLLRQVEWGVERFAALRPLHAALQERAAQSDVAAELQAAIRVQMTDRLGELLRPHVDPDAVRPTADAIFIFVQGLLSLPLTRSQRRSHIRFLVTHLVPGTHSSS